MTNAAPKAKTTSQNPRMEDLQDNRRGFLATTETYSFSEGATTTCYFMPSEEYRLGHESQAASSSSRTLHT